MTKQFVEQAAALIAKTGLKPVNLMFDINECIYDSLSLVPPHYDLDKWEPFKGNRNLIDIRAWVVFYSYDEDKTAQLNEGTLIYSPRTDPEDLEDGEEPETANCQCYEEIDDLLVDLEQVPETHRQLVLDRLTLLTQTNRNDTFVFDSAIRIDLNEQPAPPENIIFNPE